MKRILLAALLAAGLLAPAGTAAAAVTYPGLAAAFDNASTSPAAAPAAADFDGSGHSLVAEDRTAAGWDRDRVVTVDGAQLRLPAAASGTPDNVVADGQRIGGRFTGAALAFLVTSTGAGTDGTGTLEYADGHVQDYRLEVPDWIVGPGSRLTVAFPRWNTPGGPNAVPAKLYTVAIPLDPRVPVTAVTLPKPDPGGRLHVFSIGTRPEAGPWTATWATATDDGLAPGPWTERTLRMVTRTSRGGAQVRIRLDNAYDPGPLVVGHATIAVRGVGAVPVRTPVTLTFGGQREAALPAGGQAVSDPLPFSVPAGADLLISLYLKGTVTNAPMHSVALLEMYTTADGTGDHTADGVTFPTSGTFGFWTILAGVDVTGPGGTVVAFGDSITDGWSSTPNTDSRWPDFLARRLPGRAVVNQGISGNRILQDAFSGYPDGRTAGVNALARLNRDLISQPGVRTAIVLEGINDINSGAGAEDVIAGLKRIAAELHAARIRVLAGTLTPIKGCSCSSDAHLAARTRVNAFIRDNGGVFDGYVDFDAAVRDPVDPETMRAVYDSGDHLHPGDAGYAAMAAAVPLSQL
ncbi:GDSL-type esterase/lipase family protein [Amycolatopsis lexingtonensis]|uniref:GDSL-type esterase/lipase family protein n=1 Tax=Amycolatopsis lexingtonensis TaxID=218822 RepID=UPI003F70201B